MQSFNQMDQIQTQGKLSVKLTPSGFIVEHQNDF